MQKKKKKPGPEHQVCFLKNDFHSLDFRVSEVCFLGAGNLRVHRLILCPLLYTSNSFEAAAGYQLLC